MQAYTVFLMATIVHHLMNSGQGDWMRDAVLPSASHIRLASFAVVPADTFLLVASLALAGATTVFILIIRIWDQESRDRSRRTYELTFPRDLTQDGVTAFVRSLAGVRSHGPAVLGRDSVVFETLAGAEGIEHRLRLPDELAEVVLAQLRGAVPGVRVRPLETASVPAVSVVRELRLAPGNGEIRTDQATGFATGLLAAMQPLAAHDREEIIYQLVLHPVHRPAATPTRQSTSTSTVKPSKSLERWAWQQLTSPEATGTRISEDKITEPWLAVVGRVGAASTARGRCGRLVDRVAGQVRQLDRGGARFWSRPLPRDHGRMVLATARTPILGAQMHLSGSEVATLIGWPLCGPTLPGLKLAGGRVFPPARELASTGLIVGRAVYPGQERPIGIAASDSLMHLLVSGPNGSGKSTFALNLVNQDIRAGRGLIEIDPKSDLAWDTTNCTTPDRIHDLIYLNPADSCVVGLNPLACAPDDAELVADQLLILIRDRAESWGVQLDEALRAALTLLAATPGMALTELPAVLLDAGFRGRLVASLSPVFAPTVGEFFARFESWSASQQATIASAVLNKITPWLGRRQIRAILGQAEPTWTMRDVIEGNKILVVALPSGMIGPEAADLLGGMIVSQVWNAAQGRVTTAREHRRPISLVIDELPRFVRGSGSDLPDLLARARGHGLSLVGAIQHIAQVPPILRAALLSEARNKVIFQPSADDALTYARHLPGVSAEDLMTLEARTALAQLVVGGRVTEPVTIATFPPPEPTGYGEAARAASRKKYGRDRTEVEAEIQARRRGPEPGPRRTRRVA